MDHIMWKNMKTVPKKDFGVCVHFCLRPLVPLERCVSQYRLCLIKKWKEAMTNLYTQRCRWLVDWTFHSQLVVQPKAGSMCWKFPSGLPRDRFVHVRHSVVTHTFWGQRNRMTSCNPWSTRRLWRSTRILWWRRPRRLCSGWIWFLGYLLGSGLHLCQTSLLPLTY